MRVYWRQNKLFPEISDSYITSKPRAILIISPFSLPVTFISRIQEIMQLGYKIHCFPRSSDTIGLSALKGGHSTTEKEQLRCNVISAFCSDVQSTRCQRSLLRTSRKIVARTCTGDSCLDARWCSSKPVQKTGQHHNNVCIPGPTSQFYSDAHIFHVRLLQYPQCSYYNPAC